MGRKHARKPANLLKAAREQGYMERIHDLKQPTHDRWIQECIDNGAPVITVDYLGHGGAKVLVYTDHLKDSDLDARIQDVLDRYPEPGSVTELIVSHGFALGPMHLHRAKEAAEAVVQAIRPAR